jgi:hypothetical protein
MACLFVASAAACSFEKDNFRLGGHEGDENQGIDAAAEGDPDPCTEGAVKCEGDAVSDCADHDDDGLPEWGLPSACPSSAPFCSNGVCDAECDDECAMGESRCAGSMGVEACGQTDSDSCLDWQPEVACDEGLTCASGACAPACSDACAAGAARCAGSNERQVCAQAEPNACLAWLPGTPCGDGETCSEGACRPMSAPCACYDGVQCCYMNAVTPADEASCEYASIQCGLAADPFAGDVSAYVHEYCPSMTCS